MSILVSVIITSYNTEKYIEEAISSVVSQKTNFNYEIIIGDDGSDDSSLSIIKKWKDRYPEKISYYVMKRDRDKKHFAIERASNNRLCMQRKAKGKYITFLDGDDYYTDPYMLQKLTDLLESEENSDCSVAASNINFFYQAEDRNTTLSACGEKKKKINPYDYISQSKWTHSEACLFRNRKVKIINNPLFYFDDNLLTLYYLRFGRMIYIPDVTVTYRIHNTPFYSLDSYETDLLNFGDFEAEYRFWPRMKRAFILRHVVQFERCIKNRNILPSVSYSDREKIGTDYPILYSLLNYDSISTFMKLRLFAAFLEWKTVLFTMKVKRKLGFIRDLSL